MSISPHEGSRSDRLSKILIAIDNNHKGKARYDYERLFIDLRSILEEYAKLDGYQGLNIDAIIRLIKYNEKLSLNEIEDKVVSMLMSHSADSEHLEVDDQMLRSNNQELSFSQQGASARHRRGRESKTYCWEIAEKKWRKDPTARIGDLVTALSYELQKKNMYCPTEPTIRKWLKEGEKKGRLSIPLAATAPGRPKMN